MLNRTKIFLFILMALALGGLLLSLLLAPAPSRAAEVVDRPGAAAAVQQARRSVTLALELWATDSSRANTAQVHAAFSRLMRAESAYQELLESRIARLEDRIMLLEERG